jgi:ABC-2 type transport system permease protein
MRRFAPILALIQRDLMADIRDYKVTVARLILQPAVFIFVFGHVMTGFFSVPQGSYSEVVIPGIIAMTVMNSSFSNVGGTIVTGYYFRSMEGWLLAPVGVRGLLSARIFSGVLYGTASGVIVTGLSWVILGVTPRSPVVYLLMVMAGSTFFSLLTVIFFLVPERPDKGQEVFSFLIMPMTFFGCTFYSYSMLKAPFSYIVLLFPTTYISEGLRAAYNPHMPHIDTISIFAGLTVSLIILCFLADRAFQRRFRDFLW